MFLFKFRFIVPILSMAFALQAAPDISNLDNCINEVRQANKAPPTVPTFDQYARNYKKLIADLQTATPMLPYVYQQAAAKPLIQYLTKMGERKFLRLFSQNPRDDLSSTLQQIIPDAVLSILFHNNVYVQSVDAFQEISSDLYDSFISDESRVSKETGQPIALPTYGVIPPLVKFGNADDGPYTWPCDTTTQLLGMKCAIVSLPPAQIKGGLLAWSSLGHETGGHDIVHADAGLLEELAKNVHDSLLKNFKSEALATYWANCMDETVSDVLGMLNLGPSAGIGLIGYFRSFGNGKLRNIGSTDDPHPIDLLRGYLAAAVANRLSVQDAAEWQQLLTNETSKDNDTLFLYNQQTRSYTPFPVALDVAIASTQVVADTLLKTKLKTLQGHSLQEIQNWNDNDEAIIQSLITALKANGQLPANLHGAGFYAAHVVGACTLAALEANANIGAIFGEMVSYLDTMHQENPTWSKKPTAEALLMLKRGGETRRTKRHKLHSVIIPLPADIKTPEVDSEVAA